MAKSNSKEALNLYAQVEDMLGIKEYAPKLYAYYYDILDNLEFNSLLDIGCGSGDFLVNLDKRYRGLNLYGVDKSSKMVELTRLKGISASTLELKELDTKFDIATATFDMINYLTPQEFIEFFSDLKGVIKPNGYFLFDVNSEFGLSELAVGNFIAQDDNRFLTIESFYEAGVYDSNFTLFKKEGNCYKKYTQSISQYYYSEDFFELLGGWELENRFPIDLYSMGEFDKVIYTIKNI